MKNPSEILLLGRPKPKLWDGRHSMHAVIDRKMDGIRVTYAVNADRSVWMRGRDPTIELWNKARVHSSVREVVDKTPIQCLVDCELWAPGKPASEVSHILSAGSEAGELRLTPFAIPWLHGADARGLKPEDVSTELFQLFGSSLRDAEAEALAEDSTIYKGQEYAVEQLRDLASLRKLEGYVVKMGHWCDWWKVKPSLTVDAFVTAVQPGQGKHLGRVGAFEVAVFDKGSPRVIAEVGTGFSDTEREHSKQSPIGRVMEVGYDSVGAKGSLRFPRFIRWRDDKPMNECSIDQLP